MVLLLPLPKVGLLMAGSDEGRELKSSVVRRLRSLNESMMSGRVDPHSVSGMFN